MSYILRTDGWIIREKDNANIPPDQFNADWQEYQSWLAEGNKPTDASPVPAPTSSVTGNQWGLALGDMGLSDAWETAVAGAKAKYRVRANLLARDTVILDGDPLIVRLCGTTLPYAAIFSHAQSMPTA